MLDAAFRKYAAWKQKKIPAALAAKASPRT